MSTTSVVRRAAAVAIGLAAAGLVTPALASAAPAHFTGVVVSPTGKPVPNVFVTDGNDLGLTGYTDANGRYDFANPNGLPGHIYVCAKLAQDARQGGAAGWFDACRYLDPGVDATITFLPGAAVGGVVVDVKSGRPLAGATVSVLDNNDNDGHTATTDAHGYYRYRNLRPTSTLAPGGAGKVTAAAPNGYLPTTEVGPDAQVTLSAGQVRNDQGIQVAPAVVYSGTVVDGSAAPVAGATVAVKTYGTFRNVVTGADGTWSVPSAWSGVADVCAWQAATKAHPTGLAATCTVSRSAALAVQVPLTLATEGGAVKGSIVAPAGATVLASVAVPLADGDSLLLPVVQKNGTFTGTGLPAGTYQVRAYTGGSSSAVGYSKPVTVTAGSTSTFSTITLATGDN